MAIVTSHSHSAPLTDDNEIREFLAPHSITFDRWPIPDTIRSLAKQTSLSPGEKEQILAGFRPKLDELAHSHGYVQSDIVVLEPDTPGVETALAKFDKEHFHDDDEVRYIIDGRGVFGFVGQQEQRFEIEVHPGEYIVIPANGWHWFTLCEDRRIKAIRIFKDTSGWVANYRDGSQA